MLQTLNVVLLNRQPPLFLTLLLYTLFTGVLNHWLRKTTHTPQNNVLRKKHIKNLKVLKKIFHLVISVINFVSYLL